MAIETNKLKKTLDEITDSGNLQNMLENAKKYREDIQATIGQLGARVTIGEKAVGDVRRLIEAAGLDPNEVTIDEAVNVITKMRKLATKNATKISEKRFMRTALGLFAFAVVVISIGTGFAILHYR